MTATAPQASFILTWRDGGDSSRRDNLRAVLAWLARYPAFEVIVVEQDAAPQWRGPLPHPHCRHLFAFNPGPFNKSWGLNIGLRQSAHDWLAFGDADVVVGDQLAEALRYLAHGFGAVKPYRQLLDLDREESGRIAAGDFDWLPQRAARSGAAREDNGEFIVFAGGIVLMDRATVARVGGWDERFRGWGGEDDAMSYKLERLRVPSVELQQRPALHLWHPRAPETMQGQAHYADNCAVLDDYQRLSDAELERLGEIQMQIVGNLDKYRPQ